MRKNIFLFILLVVFLTAPVFAQKEDFWFCPAVETAVYSSSGLAYGGGMAIGYGTRTAIGFKALWFADADGLEILEFNFLLRRYFGGNGYSGFFLQAAAGPVLFAFDSITIPSEHGMISVGLNAGWRLLLGDLFFVEPNIRAGYPYFVGGGILAGLRY
ncbi:MAG: hypothetical protein LBH44_01660 [Treponema sp.]|jgi:hypothetical protein|nr:hypothetical protein [Treponema sp.]